MRYLLNFTEGKDGDVIGCMLLDTANCQEAIRDVEMKLDLTNLYMFPYEAPPESIFTQRFEETFGENLFVEVDRVRVAFQDLIDEFELSNEVDEIDAFDA